MKGVGLRAEAPGATIGERAKKRFDLLKMAFVAYLVSVSADRDAEGASKTKVGELDHTVFIDEQVLRLQIAMQNAV